MVLTCPYRAPQFRRFVDDCKINEATRTDADLIFTRVNRVVDDAIVTQARKLATRLGAKSAAVRTDKMVRAIACVLDTSSYSDCMPSPSTPLPTDSSSPSMRACACGRT